MSKFDVAVDHGKEIVSRIRDLEHRMHMTDMFMFEVKDELISILESKHTSYFDSIETHGIEEIEIHTTSED